MFSSKKVASNRSSSDWKNYRMSQWHVYLYPSGDLWLLTLGPNDFPSRRMVPFDPVTDGQTDTEHYIYRLCLPKKTQDYSVAQR